MMLSLNFSAIKRQLCRHILILLGASSWGVCDTHQSGDRAAAIVENIRINRDNPEELQKLLPIVGCSFTPSKYELILMNTLRDVDTSMEQFRNVSQKIGELLVNKVIECLPTTKVDCQSPVGYYEGDILATGVELVSIMRSGDALLETFLVHFPHAKISKILIQRDEETAAAHFKYMKLSSTIASGHYVVITEPMIATGGSLHTAISLLKEKGVREDRIIIASVCTAPEGLVHLCQAFPDIKVVMTVMDEKLNERKYIVPGLGDFGDRYFGTVH